MTDIKLSREAFITKYSGDSAGLTRHPWGVSIGAYKMYALPCGCGEAFCTGWAMIQDAFLTDHLEMHYWPDEWHSADAKEAADEIEKLRAALRDIRDMGPMSVDDQRWRIAKDALGGK